MVANFTLLALFSSISSITRTLTGATTSGQSGPGSDDNVGVFRVSKSFSITGTSPSDCLVSYIRTLVERVLLSVEMQSVYSTAPADRAISFYILSSRIRIILNKSILALNGTLAITITSGWSLPGWDVSEK